MRTPSAQSDESDSIASYLADREGLEGKVREAFLDLLHNAFGFKLQRPRWATAALGALIAALAVTGLLSELNLRSERFALMAWIGNIVLAAMLISALVRAGRQPRRSNREIEWRVYCLLIRPVIISERPGLLDRNSADTAETGPKSGIRFRLNCMALWDDSWPNLWLPATVGWSLGTMALLGWQLQGPVDGWIFILPLGFTILMPLGWGLCRLFMLWRVERTVGEQQ